MNSHAYREAPHGHVRDEDLPKAPPLPPKRGYYERVLDARDAYGVWMRVVGVALLPVVIAGALLQPALMIIAYVITGNAFASCDPCDFYTDGDLLARSPFPPGTRALYTGSPRYAARLRAYCVRSQAAKAVTR